MTMIIYRCFLCGDRYLRDVSDRYGYEAYAKDVIESTAIAIEKHLKESHGLNKDLFTEREKLTTTDGLFDTDYDVIVQPKWESEPAK